MGSRGQVYIKDEGVEGVYLYTHWNADELSGVVKRALAKRWRWDDSEYLARIIFDEMIGQHQGEQVGFGVGTTEHGDIKKLIIVDCWKKRVTVEDRQEGSELSYSFQEFIEK